MLMRCSATSVHDWQVNNIQDYLDYVTRVLYSTQENQSRYLQMYTIGNIGIIVVFHREPCYVTSGNIV